MSETRPSSLTRALEAKGATALPAKEVVSLLDLNLNLEPPPETTTTAPTTTVP